MNAQMLPQSRSFVSLQSAGDSIPKTFGEQDARAGATCVPEMYFIHRADQVEYCQGYAAVAGPNDTTRYFTGHIQ